MLDFNRRNIILQPLFSFHEKYSKKCTGSSSKCKCLQGEVRIMDGRGRGLRTTDREEGIQATKMSDSKEKRAK
jgi:hypothetical protein